MKSGKKKTGVGRPKKQGVHSNEGRNGNAWHPWWIWQLLRRNQHYRVEVEKIYELIRPSDEEIKNENDNLSKPKHEIDFQQSAAFQDRLWHFCEAAKHEQILDPSVYLAMAEDYENKGYTPFLELSTECKYFLDPAHTNVFSRMPQHERDILQKFRSKYSGIISFPLNPLCNFPNPDTLFSIIHARPIMPIRGFGSREFVERLVDIAGPAHHLLAFNLHFTDAKILESMKKMLKNLRKQNEVSHPIMKYAFSGVESKKWNELHRQLSAYDRLHSGFSPTETAKELFNSKKPSKANVTKCQQWSEHLEKVIAVFDLTSTI